MKKLFITLVSLVMVITFSFVIAGGCGYTPNTTTSTPVPDSSPKAVAIAAKYAGFKATAPPSFWYEDSTSLTAPALSFKLKAEPSNQDVLFIVFDDMMPVEALENFVGLPPFTSVQRADKLAQIKVDENFQILCDGNLHWFVGRYKEGDKDRIILVGSFTSRVSGKSILVVGKALDASKEYDYKSTLWLCDQMCLDGSQK